MRLITLSIRVRGSLPLKLALYLTLARIVISPIFLLIYLNYQEFGISSLMLPIILLGLLTLSELSDFFDGFIARKWDQVTDLGKILDPMADSIARISVFLTFTQGVVKLPLLLVLVFLYRDVIISMLRTLCALRGYTLAARTSGKIKAVIQAIAAFVILLLMIPFAMGHLPIEKLQNISFYVVAAAAVYTLFSGIEYIYANLSFIKQAWSKKP
jgi:CDP-diacylglycerol---glycerol-3-phosphate 3-phosphatidyltransferase